MPEGGLPSGYWSTSLYCHRSHSPSLATTSVTCESCSATSKRSMQLTCNRRWRRLQP